MRERSHKLGQEYQQDTKAWLVGRHIFGYRAEEYGDAYDPTRKATEMGGKGFDFSLKLISGREVVKILYAECKYRNEKSGSAARPFIDFLSAVCHAVKNASDDEVERAIFIFLSNVPPDNWRAYLRQKESFMTASLPHKLDLGTLATMTANTHILVLSPAIIKGGK